MFNELWVSTTHVEAQITLEEETAGRPDRIASNWVQDIRELELAIMKRDDGTAGTDQTITIPQSSLLRSVKKGSRTEYQVVRDEQLPFDVQVLTFFRNTKTLYVAPDETPEADAGHGRFYRIEEAPPITGVDKGENQPGAYVRFLDKETGESLGTHLVSPNQTYYAQWAPTLLDDLEEVKVGGQTYEVYLRHKRINKPYTVTLKTSAATITWAPRRPATTDPKYTWSATAARRGRASIPRPKSG